MIDIQSLVNHPEAGVYASLEELLGMRYRLKELKLFASNNRRSPLVGAHHSKLRGRGIDFDQVRVYLPGDDIRSIDWRVTAKTQQAHTKLFHEEKERPIFLLIEQSKQLFLGTGNSLKSVVAAQLGSFLGWAALENNDRIGGLVFNEQQHKIVRPRLNKRSLLQLIGYLHQMNQSLNNEFDIVDTIETDNPLLNALKQAREVLRPGSLLIVLVDERSLDQACAKTLQHLAIHLDVALLPVYDELDHALPQAGMLRFVQQDKELLIDTNNAKLRKAYAQQALKRQHKWQELSKKIGAKLLPINTAQDVVDQLKTLLNVKR